MLGKYFHLECCTDLKIIKQSYGIYKFSELKWNLFMRDYSKKHFYCHRNDFYIQLKKYNFFTVEFTRFLKETNESVSRIYALNWHSKECFNQKVEAWIKRILEKSSYFNLTLLAWLEESFKFDLKIFLNIDLHFKYIQIEFILNFSCSYSFSYLCSYEKL